MKGIVRIIRDKTSPRREHDKILQQYLDQGFERGNPRDDRILKTAFLNGLESILRDELYKTQPEAGSMSMETILPILKAMEYQRNKKKKRTTKSQHITRNSVQNDSQVCPKNGQNTRQQRLTTEEAKRKGLHSLWKTGTYQKKLSFPASHAEYHS